MIAAVSACVSCLWWGSVFEAFVCQLPSRYKPQMIVSFLLLVYAHVLDMLAYLWIISNSIILHSIYVIWMLVQGGVQYWLQVQILAMSDKQKRDHWFHHTSRKGCTLLVYTCPQPWPILAHFVVGMIALGLFIHFISVMKSHLKRLESIFL